jgi:hypothetical protein
MTPVRIDHYRAKRNPWGLTPHQCYVLRLVCEHGGSKRAAHAVPEANQRLLEHHLHHIRKAMGLFGADIRIFLNWDRWISEQAATKNRDSRAVARQTSTKGEPNEDD